MTTQPTPPAPAEVCERLKNWQWFCENTAKAFLRYEMPIEHIKELGETLTAALLLIEQGEKERERLVEVTREEMREATRKMLQDPHAVLANILRGTIALPSCYVSTTDTNGPYADLRAQLAAATERVKRLEESLSDMVCMSETLIKNIAEFSKDPRILTTPSPRLDSARQLLAARAQPTTESK